MIMNNRGRFLGVILIGIGALLMLSKLNIFNFSISFSSLISTALHLWPALLIVIGINIIFRNGVIKAITWILFLMAVVAYMIMGPIDNNGWVFHFYQSDKSEKLNASDIKFSKTVSKEGDMAAGEMNIDLGACSLDLNGTDQAAVKINSNIKGIETEGNYDHKKLSYKVWEGKVFDDIINTKRTANISLYTNVPWDLNLDTGATGVNLDMRDLIINKLTLDIGAGNGKVIFGNKSKNIQATIDGGASNLKIYVPQNAGVKIESDSGLLSNNFDSVGLKKMNDYYVTDNYENAANLVNIDLSMGASNVELIIE